MLKVCNGCYKDCALEKCIFHYLQDGLTVEKAWKAMEKRMIVDYDKEIDVVYISKFVDHRWIQVGFTSDEIEQIVTARQKK
jgi:hypothetical protein